MSRLSLNGLQTFLAIAEQGSLRAAAVSLGVRPPAVSLQLKAFEEELGVSLFTRNTRSVVLTDAGEVLLHKSSSAMDTVRDAIAEARVAGSTRKGSLRISLPYRAYRHIVAPRLTAFQQAYPEIELELSINESLIDIVGERFHAGIRLGDHLQDDMIAVRLTPPMLGATIASPDYLERHGRPGHPRDLLDHNCIRYRRTGSQGLSVWRFQGPEGVFTVDVKGTLILNDFRSVVDAARDGLGLGWSIRIGVEEDLQSGRLESVLDPYALERPGFFLYFPRASLKLEILRLFVDFMKMQPARPPESGQTDAAVQVS